MAQPGLTTASFHAPSLDRQEDDADSDLEELQGDIERFDQTVQAFLSSQGSSNAQAQISGGIRRNRGPRKVAEPRGDIKARLAKVNKAFMRADYDAARDMVFEIIRINAETHQAWVTLGSIFRELGDFDKALGSMVYAAHLRPKDVSGWLKCAEFALDAPEEDQGSLKTARLCYAAAIKAEPKNLEARLGKAVVCHRQGHIPAAIYEYSFVLQYRQDDIDVARKLAEACVDNSKSLESVVPSAIVAFERCLVAVDPSKITWYDTGVFAELFASIGRHHDAIRQLKNLARRLAGRADDSVWTEWDQDDREWDDNDVRRREVSGFDITAYPLDRYGLALPLDLRTRLATYRLSLGEDAEAMRHLLWVDPNDDETRTFVAEFPLLIHDVADHLFQRERYQDAHFYYQLLKDAPGPTDAVALFQLGRCYVAFEDPITAEEYFLSAIEADQDSIDARIELANLYENAKEDEEALILATEAMALREAHEKKEVSDYGHAGRFDRSRFLKANLTRRMRAAWTAAGLARPRYRPKRLADPEKKKRDEQARAEGLRERYKLSVALKLRIDAGERHLMGEWMEAAREVVDGFRSLRKFYSWEKYLRFLGSTVGLVDEVRRNNDQSLLGKMVERLSKNLAPKVTTNDEATADPRGNERDEYQGIPFADWLALFLDYALSLALADQPYDSYQVCEAAKDCIAFGTEQSSFLIHVAWCACALVCRDEEKCSAVAREFMRDDKSMSDPCRMFSLLCRLCESPPSWYSSGPTQKYLLRQIRAIDIARMQSAPGSISGITASDPKLDVCLLMLYGHILYTSASYTFALNYFLRALALDPENPMINFSVGLGYIHYALKRQSGNRQFIIMQGLAFIQRYFNIQMQSSNPVERQMACYDMGRAYHLLGLHNLAHRFYQRCLESASKKPPSPTVQDATLGAAFNTLTTSLVSNDLVTAKAIVTNWLIL